MSWSRRSLLAALALAGCGFRPALGPTGVLPRRGMIALQGPQSRDGYAVLQELELRLGAPNAPSHQLTFSISMARERVIDDGAQSTQRDHLRGEAGWILLEGGQEKARGTARRFVTLDVGNGLIKDTASADSAQARLASALADEILRQVLAAL